MNIDAERLYASLDTLGRIGAYQDATSGLTGVCRLALTPADGEGRRHVVASDEGRRARGDGRPHRQRLRPPRRDATTAPGR